MYIYYVCNAFLRVVYSISCIILCYCCTLTLNILIKLARDIISYSSLAYNTYISLLNIPPPYQWDESRMLYSIIKLGTYPLKKFHQNRPSSPFHLSLVLAATCTCCQVLATQGIQSSSTNLQPSTTHRCQDCTSATSTAATWLSATWLPAYCCLRSIARMITILQFHCICSV